jgi:hypothetical protein
VRFRLSALVLSSSLLACAGGPGPAPVAAPGGAAAGPHLPAPLEAAVTRVRALIDLPDQRSVEDAFAPSFLKEIPVDKVQAVFLQVHGVAPCTVQSVVSTDSPTSGKVHLACRSGGEDVTLSVEPSPPYKITLLIIKPSL